MFPNLVFPNNGIFVKERLKAMSNILDISIIAPVPYFFFISQTKKYKNIHMIPTIENFESLVVNHPRYFLIPKYLKFLDGYLYYWSTNNFFSEQIKIINPDILDFHWVYPDAFAGLMLARRYQKKIVVTIRGNESICYFEKSLRKKQLINTLQHVDHIIAVSNDMKTKVVNEYGVRHKNVTVIPNGIQPQKFKLIDRRKAREFCGLDQDKKYILSLSRLSHEKGLEFLFRAFASLHIEDVEVLVVGDGPLKDNLHVLANDLGIAKRLKFIGAVAHEKTLFWYNAADVFCLPSLWEGCPNVIIESLACGTPVVSTLVGGIPDLVPDEDYGFLVPSGVVGPLAVALDNALNKPWNHRKIAQYGSLNTWDHVAGRVSDVFQSVLEA